MTRRRSVLAALAAAGGLLLLAPAAPAATSEPSFDVTVELDKERADLGPGERLEFTSRLTNDGGRDLTDLVAHVSILSSDPGVYVDPEDWSPRRTQYVESLEAGATTELSWDVQAVTAGPMVLYVSVTDAQLDTVGSSRPLGMTVGGQRVVDAANVLPLVLWPPAVVLAVLAATLARRRRHR